MLNRDSLRVLAAFSMHNCGGSDQATALLFAAAWKVIFIELDLSITNEQLGKGTPCQSTLINAEYRSAGECLMLVADEMKGCKYYSLSQDAGHRGGLDHLIKMISYAIRGDDGVLQIKSFCLDIDTCGKTAEEVANGIDKSIKRLGRLAPAKCISLTGDAGGCGAVQTIHPLLVQRKAVIDWS